MTAPCPALGLIFTATLGAGATEADADALTDDLIDLLEANELVARGGGGQVIRLVIYREGGQATDADRQMILEWAREWEDVASIVVTDVVDLNEAGER